MTARSLICIVLLAHLQPISIFCATSGDRAERGDIDENTGVQHFLLVLKGRVTLKRQGWTNYASARFGTTVKRGDLLRIDQSSEAIVVCSDLIVHRLQGVGVRGIPCDEGNLPAVLLYSGDPINVTRGDIFTEFPVIVSPRRTKVINAHPVLRWTQVPGLRTFTVNLRGPNLDWTTTVISATEVTYPGKPPLTPGSTYKLTVAGGGRSSNEDPEPGLGFTLLKTDEARAIQETEMRIKNLPLPNEAREFLTAHFYASQGLDSEAIEQLEWLSTKLNEASVFRSQGDLYLKAGLYRFAEKSYLYALQRSFGTADLEGEAMAQRTLGFIYGQALGNRQKGLQHLRQASKLYKQLGDSAASARIANQLTALQQ